MSKRSVAAFTITLLTAVGLNHLLSVEQSDPGLQCRTTAPSAPALAGAMILDPTDLASRL